MTNINSTCGLAQGDTTQSIYFVGILQSSSVDRDFQPDSTTNHTLDHTTTDSSERWRSPILGWYRRIVPQMPLFGYPGPLFFVIHYTALVCIVLSGVMNIGLLLHIFVFSGRRRSENSESASAGPTGTPSVRACRSRVSFWRRTRGERLVAYLAIADLGYSVWHSMDKGYYAFMVENPPDMFCAVIGFFFVTFTLSQWFIVLFTAISSFSLVVIGKKISHGRHDWIILAVVYGVPVLNSTILFFLGITGQSGAWCAIDLRTVEGRIYSQLFSNSQLLICAVMALAYGCMWVTMKRTARSVDADSRRYRRSANVMAILVATFFVQWWSFALFNAWNQFATPPSFFPVITGILVNLGGVYDCVTYTIIRRRLLASGQNKSAVRRESATMSVQSLPTHLIMPANVNYM